MIQLILHGLANLILISIWDIWYKPIIKKTVNHYIKRDVSSANFIFAGGCLQILLVSLLKYKNTQTYIRLVMSIREVL